MCMKTKNKRIIYNICTMEGPKVMNRDPQLSKVLKNGLDFQYQNFATFNDENPNFYLNSQN